MSAAGAGGGANNAAKKAAEEKWRKEYMEALEKAKIIANPDPVALGTRASKDKAAALVAAQEAPYKNGAGSSVAPVQQAQQGQGRRRKHRKSTKKHSRRRRTHRRR